MTELEKLIEQKKELENRIKALKTNETEFGMVRIFLTERRGGYYNVQNKVNTLNGVYAGQKESIWLSVIRERTKEEVMHKIRVLISDLSDLLKHMEEEKDEESCNNNGTHVGDVSTSAS